VADTGGAAPPPHIQSVSGTDLARQPVTFEWNDGHWAIHVGHIIVLLSLCFEEKKHQHQKQKKELNLLSPDMFSGVKTLKNVLPD